MPRPERRVPLLALLAAVAAAPVGLALFAAEPSRAFPLSSPT